MSDAGTHGTPPAGEARLLLLGPVRSHFCLRTGALSGFSTDYVDFWQRVADGEAEADPRLGEIEYLHAGLDLYTTGWTDVGQDASRAPSAIVRLHPRLDAETLASVWATALADVQRHFAGGEGGPPGRRPVSEAEAEWLRRHLALDTGSPRIDLLDHTVALFEAALPIGGLFDEPGETARGVALRRLDLAEALSSFFAGAYVAALYPQLHVFIAGLAQRKGPVLQDHELTGYPDLAAGSGAGGRLLWTSRTLELPPEKGDGKATGRGDHLARHWLTHATTNEAAKEEVRKLLDGECTYSMRWLNYVHRPLPPEAVGEASELPWGQARDMVRLGQYTYAALDVLGTELDRVIGRSHQPGVDRNIRRLHRRLADLVARTELLVLDFRERRKHLPPRQRRWLEGLLDGWIFDEVVASCREKTRLCSDRIQALRAKLSDRNAIAADLLMMTLAAIVFFSLFLEISQYGRTLATDATLGLRDEGFLDLVSWVSGLSTDAGLGCSAVFVLLAGVVYYLFRSRQRS